MVYHEKKKQEGVNQVNKIITNNKTGTEINYEGVCALGEALKVNTTLTRLKLGGAQHKESTKHVHSIINNKQNR